MSSSNRVRLSVDNKFSAEIKRSTETCVVGKVFTISTASLITSGVWLKREDPNFIEEIFLYRPILKFQDEVKIKK